MSFCRTVEAKPTMSPEFHLCPPTVDAAVCLSAILICCWLRFGQVRWQISTCSWLTCGCACPKPGHFLTHLFDPSWTLGGLLDLPTSLYSLSRNCVATCLLQRSFSFPLSNLSGTYCLGRLEAGFQSSPGRLVHLTSDHFPSSCLWLVSFGEEGREERERERPKDYGMRFNPCMRQTQSEFSNLTADRKSFWSSRK